MTAVLRTIFLLTACLVLPALAAQSPVLWSGGITQAERDSAPEDGTRLEFFVSGGHFLSAINVTITNDEGRQLVNTVTTGPWLLLDLEPGTYRVQAARGNGDTQGGSINVTGDNDRFGFMFPDN